MMEKFRVVFVQVRSRWKALPGTWAEKRTASSHLRSWTRVKTWPFPSPTISSTPRTTHTSQVRTHIEAACPRRSIWLLTDSAHTSFLLLHMTRSLVHLGIWLWLHRWAQPGSYLAGQSIKCAGACEAPFACCCLFKRLSNQVVPWNSIHWYSWVKYFFRLVVTVTGSWQCTSMAGTIQRPFSLQWLLEFIYSNLFRGELESIESFK